MSRIFLLALVGAAGLNYLAPFARSERPHSKQSAAVAQSTTAAQPATDDQAGDDDAGVMIDITERGMPSDAEWAALHERAQLEAEAQSADRASAGANSGGSDSSGSSGFGAAMSGSGGGGSGAGRIGFKSESATPPAAAMASAYSGGLSDFKSPVITHMNTRYFAMNPDNGTLCSFGKMGKDQRYDRYGQINGVEFEIDANQWTKHFVIDGKALAKLAGSRWMEFAGVGLEGELNNSSKIEVTFVGTAVPKAEVIHQLNENVEALEYIDALQHKRAAYDKKGFKLFAGEPPPAPKVVLANVIMLDGEFSKALDASVDGKLHSRVLNDGIELKMTKQNGEQMTLRSPVVRCYRTYSIEFKTDDNGRPMRVSLADPKGREHQVPQVFDLTPDL